MNTNKIYFVQTVTETGKRHAWVVSSPSLADAVTEIKDNWCGDDEEVVHSEQVGRVWDTDESMDGKTYVKIHN